MLNVFHISDLHYTANSGQLRDSARSAVQGILRLARDLKDQGVLGANLIVCITGDLVQSGAVRSDAELSDFDAVQSDLLEPLMRELDLEPQNIFLVPGNHELDREAVADEDRLRQGQYPAANVCEADVDADMGAKLAGYLAFVEKRGYSSVSAVKPRIGCFEVLGQQIVCFNGLAGSYSRGGYGDKGELFVLGTEYGNCLSAVKKNAIVLTHHPLSWFADNCATDLKEFFASKQIRLLTGHIHAEGVDWMETSDGSFAIVQAGASAEVGSANQVAVSWFPESDSAAVRHYRFDRRTAQFAMVGADETKVVPSKAGSFFRRTSAYFDPELIAKASRASIAESEFILEQASGKKFSEFVAPDIEYFPEDQFSGRRVRLSSLIDDSKNLVISGPELSGKSSLLHYLTSKVQREAKPAEVALLIDFRSVEAGHALEELVQKRLRGFGLSESQGTYLMEIGRVRLFIDNFAPGSPRGIAEFTAFTSKYKRLRWAVGTRGDERYLHSRAPGALSQENVSYYQLSETTLPTVLAMIDAHGNGGNVEKPRAVVEQVFRSINNLRAPRTIFYVNSLVEIFLDDGSVEPLNRYLLIENLLSDRIRAAHREELPGQPVDMEMLETFIGQIAHRLMARAEPYLSKADFYALVDEFVARKGIQKKRFDADTVLAILQKSFVLRDYEFGYGFMMLSIEDYFLAKHMSKDREFRSEIMSPQGLLTYPSVAEYYVAQNPSDEPRIEEVLNLIESFSEEVAPVVDAIRESSIEAFKTAHPGGGLEVREELIERLAELDDSDESTTLSFEDPKPVGRTKRVRFAPEERGAVFLQLGASILGVTRTLDQEQRIKIFERLRGVLLTSLHSLPMIAQHLADGKEIRFRGTTIKADYVGELSVQDNRFYIILRGMVFNLLKNFATWSGSPSFFNAAVKLRRNEDNELVRSALFAQNIEADLTEALEFIPEILSDIDSLILKENIVHLYLNALTLIPIERDDQARAVEKLTDVTLELDPPQSSSNKANSENRKTKLRQSYSDRIGYNAYIGRLVRGQSKPKK